MCPILTSDVEAAARAELDRWSGAGRTARLWLRDDDAQEPGGALDALLSRLRTYRAPCLLAVVPMRAGDALAQRLRMEPLVRVAMHGAWHTNHAGSGRKAEETPIDRGIDAIMSEWAVARDRLCTHFGAGAGFWYVPPWNRIEREVAARLPSLGFRAISRFTSRGLGLAPALAEANTHVDIMDWKGGRVGRTIAAVMADLTAELAHARLHGWRPVGLLSHHLVHDAQAWETLDAILELTSRHPAARWCRPDDLLAEAETAPA
jgi:hypothetical protein